MDWIKTSRIIFAVTMIAIGAAGLIGGAFAPIWLPVPKTFPARELLAYLTSLVTLASGGGLLVKRTAAPAALALLFLLVVWILLFKGPPVVREPLVEGVYQSLGENAVVIAGAWVLFAQSNGRRFGLRTAYIVYGLALIAFGLSHFFYVGLTAPLVPNWLPAHVFWAYFTGVVYLTTGIAMVTGFMMRIAAVVAAVQITLITFIVWGTIVAAGHMSILNQQETILSWTLTAAAWVIAASFERGRWFSRLAVGGFAIRRFARL